MGIEIKSSAEAIANDVASFATTPRNFTFFVSPAAARFRAESRGLSQSQLSLRVQNRTGKGPGYLPRERARKIPGKQKESVRYEGALNFDLFRKPLS
jgi:hypothetical protein